MLLDDLLKLYLREIATLERELALYPDDDSVWAELPGLPNTAGTLFLHLAGSLQHFFGATYGQTGYIRRRETEFSRRGVSRSELGQELAGARTGVQAAFARLEEQELANEFPVRYAEGAVSVQLTLLQFLSHLAFHLGQIDYHRRAVTGDRTSAGAMDPAVLRP